jgi:hypothetical protein
MRKVIFSLLQQKKVFLGLRREKDLCGLIELVEKACSEALPHVSRDVKVSVDGVPVISEQITRHSSSHDTRLIMEHQKGRAKIQILFL